MKIFVIGDMHGGQAGDTDKLKGFGKDLTKNDVLINLGDFGFIWYHDKHPKRKQDDAYLKWLSSQKYTFAFVDGNHENFDLIEQSPIIEKWNGKVNEVYPGIYRLRRGEVYTINGKKIFVLGGAMSNPNQKEGNYSGRGRNKKLKLQKVWWEKEIPSKEEFSYALDNLKKHNNKVDYVLTHTCSTETIKDIFHKTGRVDYNRLTDPVSIFLDKLNIEYKSWHFGHHHQDVDLGDRFCHYKKAPFELF